MSRGLRQARQGTSYGCWEVQWWQAQCKNHVEVNEIQKISAKMLSCLNKDKYLDFVLDFVMTTMKSRGNLNDSQQLENNLYEKLTLN
jgi:hypothetical protein